MKDIEEEKIFPQSASERRKLMKKLSVFDYYSLMKYAERENIDSRHVFRMWRHIARDKVNDIDTLADLPKKLREFVKERCSFTTLSLCERLDSQDFSTTKLIFSLFDQHKIESVIMRYGHVPFDSFSDQKVLSSKTLEFFKKNRLFRCAPRASVCVSSQVGCAMKCRFCATGTMGLLASLTSGEIIEQFFLAQQIEGIRNVVFMGMGEPLDNYDEVIDAIRLLSDVRVFSLASHRISISTVGVVPRLKQLKQDAPQISLALSLHAPTQEIRLKIVPSARSWNLNFILEAAIDFVDTQRNLSKRLNKNRRLMVEYVLIKDINAMAHVADRLGNLLQPHSSLIHLNLIPYNPSFLTSCNTLRNPSQDEIDTFISIVRSYGIKTTIRQTMGQDIFGACGQLVIPASSMCNALIKPIHPQSTLAPFDIQYPEWMRDYLDPATCYLLKPFVIFQRFRHWMCTCSGGLLLLYCLWKRYSLSRFMHSQRFSKMI